MSNRKVFFTPYQIEKKIAPIAEELTKWVPTLAIAPFQKTKAKMRLARTMDEKTEDFIYFEIIFGGLNIKYAATYELVNDDEAFKNAIITHTTHTYKKAIRVL